MPLPNAKPAAAAAKPDAGDVEQLEQQGLDGESNEDETSDENPDPAGRSSDDIAAESLAAKRGWVPKEEFKGKPSEWVDAETFNKRGDNFNKVLQKRVNSLENELKEFKGTAEAFKKFHRESMEGKQRELDTALRSLRAQQREAVRDGDDDAADQLDARIDVLKDEKAAVAKSLAEPPKQQPAEEVKTPEMKEWEADNPWFVDDLKLQAYAVNLAQELVRNGEKSRGREFLDKVTAQMKEDFPTKFGNPKRLRPGAAESGSPADGAKHGRTAKDLPEEDRKLMKQFVDEGWTTEKKFLAEYRWD